MNSPNQTRWVLPGAFAASVGVAICCLGPLLAVALGVGGAWASRVMALEPYRPVLIVATVAILALAFYREHRRCGSCSLPDSRRPNRWTLWIVSPVVLAFLLVPYVAPYLASAKVHRPAPTTTASGQDACCTVPSQNGAK